MTEHKPLAKAYCATCREWFYQTENPPYAVIHQIDGGHLHAETRRPFIGVA